MTLDKVEARPPCPECGAAMLRDGFQWSGRKRVQRWLCPKCGRRSTMPHQPPLV